MPPTPLKQLKDIPSIAYLYRTKHLKPALNTDLPNGNQDVNNKICTIQYDLTKLQVDAIVNAANRRLLGGGGVDGAIHMAAGPELLEECKTLGGCPTGSAKITDAYRLPCKKVIHAVGPIFDNEQISEPELRGCYKTALQLAVENDCKSVAFSAISTGIYGYPSRSAAKAALREVVTFLRQPEGKKLDKVVFCSFLDKDVDAYAKEIPEVCPPTDEDLSESVSSSMESKPEVEIVQEKEEKICQQDIQTSVQDRSSSGKKVSSQDDQENECQGRDPDSKSRIDVDDGTEATDVQTETVDPTADVQRHDEEERNRRFDVKVGQPASNTSSIDTSIDARQSDVSLDQIISTRDSIAASEPADSRAGDRTRLDTPVASPDRSSEDDEERWFGTRSRADSSLALKDDAGKVVRQLVSISKRLEITGCTHNWKMDDDNDGSHLWPKGRHRCSECGAIMVCRHTRQGVIGRGGEHSYLSK